MAWTIPNLFPNWGDSGEQPPADKDYQGGENVNEKHLDYLWNSLYELEDDVRSALEDIDSDKDGVVDKAEKATNVETGFTYINDAVTFNESNITVLKFRTTVSDNSVKLVDKVKTTDFGYISNDFYLSPNDKLFLSKGYGSSSTNEIHQYSLNVSSFYNDDFEPFWNILDRLEDGTVTISEPSVVNTIDWSDDGESFYIADENSIYEYTVSSSNAFDLVNASPTFTTEIDLSSEVSTEEDIAFNDDGTKFYVLDDGDVIYEYSVETGYDLANSIVNYTGNKFDTGSQTSGYTESITWGQNGNYLYVCDSRTGNFTDVYQYEFSSPYDFGSTITYTNQTADLFSKDVQTTASSIGFHPNGRRFFVLKSASTGTVIHEFGVPTNWSIDTLTTDAVEGLAQIVWGDTIQDVVVPENIKEWKLATKKDSPENGQIIVNAVDNSRNALVLDIGVNEDISNVSTDKNVILEGEILANSGSDNPTLDFVGRKYSR